MNPCTLTPRRSMPLQLKHTQGLLYRLIAAPGGVAEGLEHERGLPRGGLDAVIGGDPRMTTVERLDIYANMYFFRLLEVLKEDFSAVAAVLGEDNFHNLVTGYLTEYPPTEASVFWAGRYLADFLRTHPLRREYPYLAELAALERAIVEVFCARDIEPRDAGAMRAIAPAAMAERADARDRGAAGARNAVESRGRVAHVRGRARAQSARARSEHDPGVAARCESVFSRARTVRSARDREAAARRHVRCNMRQLCRQILYPRSGCRD